MAARRAVQRGRTVPRGTSLFAQAEAAEQRVEQILDPGSPGNPVDRQPRIAQLLGDQHRIGQLQRPASSAACASASKSCCRRSSASSSPLGKQRREPARTSTPVSSASPSPVTADTGRAVAPIAPEVRLGGDPNQAGMVGRLRHAAPATATGRPARPRPAPDRCRSLRPCRSDSRRPAVSTSTKGTPSIASGHLDHVTGGSGNVA